jgi:Skp family chaperone for outer membrane proteins
MDMSKQVLIGSFLVLAMGLAGNALAQAPDVTTLLRENQRLKEENDRLKAENERFARRIEELRKRAAGEGIRPVAVVDVIRAFNALIEKTEFDADFQGKGKEAIEQDKQKRERVDALRQRLDEQVIGSKEYGDAQKALDDAVLEHQLWLSGEQGKLLSRRNQRMEEMYNKLMESITAVARQQGFDQVMLREPDISFIGANPDQLAAMIRSRKVLWSSEDLDLTDLVVKAMNDEFVRRQRTPTGG